MYKRSSTACVFWRGMYATKRSVSLRLLPILYYASSSVETYEIKQFLNNTSEYAIFSHTWNGEEVKYQEWVPWL